MKTKLIEIEGNFEDDTEEFLQTLSKLVLYFSENAKLESGKLESKNYEIFIQKKHENKN